jgi:PIN domain nuclease of toxin-antitoxin system
LIDTHTAVWYFAGSPELSEKAQATILDENKEIYVSVVSAWENAIKRSLGRETTSLCSAAEFFSEIDARGFELLALEPRHVRPVEALPYHHRDPFDRLLITTAMSEDMTFLSADENVPKYEVSWLW